MTKIQNLKNGIKFIPVPIKGTKAITVLALFPIGSRFETKNISGISHFVEHLMFKGTKKRPTYLEISRELDAVGAEYNAFTSKDYTGYYVKINSNDQKLAFDMVSDIVFNSTLPEEEIAREKGVIVEELRMYDDNPIMAIDNLFERTFFGDYPLGWDVGGDEKTVRAISKKDLDNYYKKYYRPDNMILVVAGDINKKDLKQNLKYFGDIALPKVKLNSRYKKYQFTKEKKSLQKRVGVKTKKIDQTHVILGFPGLKYTDKKKPVLAVLLSVLSGGMSSRLFVEVREKRGLAYMIRAGSESFADVGNVYVQAGLDPKRLPEALKVIKDELLKISTEKVDKKELKSAKKNIAGHIALAMEDSSFQAAWHGKKVLTGVGLTTYAEEIKKLNKVSAEDVQSLAKQLFDFDKMHLAAIGPLSSQKIMSMLK